MHVATLIAPISICDGTIVLFQRPDTRMRLQPVPGILLAGSIVPPAIPEDSIFGTRNLITQVVENLDTGEVLVFLRPVAQPTYNAEEVLKNFLDHTWQTRGKPLDPRRGTDDDQDTGEDPLLN